MVHEKISKNSQKIALIEHFEATLEIISSFSPSSFQLVCRLFRTVLESHQLATQAESFLPDEIAAYAVPVHHPDADCIKNHLT